MASQSVSCTELSDANREGPQHVDVIPGPSHVDGALSVSNNTKPPGSNGAEWSDVSSAGADGAIQGLSYVDGVVLCGNNNTKAPDTSAASGINVGATSCTDGVQIRPPDVGELHSLGGGK